jgi:hypothetical protein
LCFVVLTLLFLEEAVSEKNGTTITAEHDFCFITRYLYILLDVPHFRSLAGRTTVAATGRALSVSVVVRRKYPQKNREFVPAFSSHSAFHS